jgi:nucleotide-binding universal stress UspA family protein
MTSVGDAGVLIRQSSEFSEIVFLGHGNRMDGQRSRRLGATLFAALQGCEKTLFVCPDEYVPVNRVVVAHRAQANRPAGDRLLEYGATWAKALGAKLAVVTAGCSHSDVQKRESVLKATMERLSIQAEIRCYVCRAAELTTSVGRSDLLVIGRYGRWWPAALWSECNTEAILQRATGPVAVLPSEVAQ